MNDSHVATNPTKKAPRRLRIALLMLAGCLAALGLGEIGLRVLWRIQGGPFDSESTRQRFEGLWNAAREFVPRAGRADVGVKPDNEAQVRILHPFYGWDEAGSLVSFPLELNDAQQRLDQNDYEVLLVGGSVADIFGHYGVPRLTERLAADPRFAGRRVRFFRYGHGGFKQPQQLGLVNFQIGLGLQPEAVLLIDGFNEVAVSNQNVAFGTSPVYPSIPHWGSLAASGITDRAALDKVLEGRSAQRALEARARRALDWGVYRSALLSRLLSAHLEGLRKRSRAAYDEYVEQLQSSQAARVLHGPPFTQDVLGNMRASVRMWLESSRSLRGLCKERGIHYVHVLQPTLLDPGSKTPTEKEQQVGIAIKEWREGVEVGYPYLRKGGEVLKAEGEVFLDASMVFRDVKETLYFDSCHFAERGNEILADFIADGFLASLPQ